MTYYINRVTGPVNVNRTSPQINVEGGVVYQINRSASGPRGQAAAQDVGWMLSGGLVAGEILNAPPLPHPATYVTIYAHSDSGFAAPKTLTVQQKRAGTVIASATLAVGPGATDWTGNITAMAGNTADVFALVTPTPADAHCIDLSVSLGSTP